MKFIIYLFCLFFTTFLQSNEVKISQLDKNSNILENTYFYIDINSQKSFSNIKSNQTIFKRFNKNFITQGYSNNTIWLKFSIHNDTNNSISKFLEIDNTMLDEIVLYKNNKLNNYIEEKTGVFHRKEFNSFMRYKFEIDLEQNEKKNYYLKVKSETSGLYFHLNILEKNDYYKKDINYQHILILFFGAILSLALYNLFIFFFTKDLAHLYYSLYIILTMITHISFTSMNLHILPLEFEAVDAYLALYYVTFCGIFMLLFSKEFLDTKMYPKINIGINIFLGMFFISLIITFFSEYYPIEEVTYILLFGLLYTLISSFYILFKGNKNAKYFVFGWGLAIFGYTMLAMKQDGLWSLIDYFPYFYEFTILSEAILFSVALASKINKNKDLEKALNTNKVLTRELHHRIKNNMQFIILMYRLKLSNIQDSKINEKLNETEGAIQAISKTHEILYNQSNIENINTKPYIENLIDEIKRGFHNKDININFNISATLDTQKAIYCGIILNELITNSFKYAFNNNSGLINISLIKKDNKYYFSIEDNGVGFNYDKKRYESFGLSFIEEIVKEELKGKVTFKNNNGTQIKIVF